MFMQNPFRQETTSTALHARLRLRLMPAQGRNSHYHRDADGRADHKAHARRAANHTEVLAALLQLSNIRDIAKEDAEIAARQAIDGASQEEEQKPYSRGRCEFLARIGPHDERIHRMIY
jgi:hypothetical protein